MYRFKKGSGLPLTHAGRRSDRDRGRRRQHRAGRRTRADQGRPGQRGRRPRSRLLRPRRHAARPSPTPIWFSAISDAGSFLGGRMRLDIDAAREAIDMRCRQATGGFRWTRPRFGIHDIVNENMANASRVQAVERGHDPSGYSLVAFGGAGPVHAWGVATPSAGHGHRAAVGGTGLGRRPAACAADLPHRAHVYRHARRARMVADRELVRGDDAEAEAVLRDAGVSADRIRYARSVDMRYRGQRKELTINVPNSKLAMNDGRTVACRF